MNFSYFIIIIFIVVLTACFWPCVPFARATRGAFLILEGAVAAMGCGGCIASCWGPSQENLKIDYDRLVNVCKCTMEYHGIALYDHSWYHSLQVPFLKGRVVYTAHECPCGVFDTQALWEDRWSWLLPGTTGSISIWSPARVLSPFPSSTVSTIDHSPCLQPTLKPSRLYVGLIVAAFPACWCSSETFKRSCQNDAKHGHSLPSHFELILWEMDHGQYDQYGHDCNDFATSCGFLWHIWALLCFWTWDEVAIVSDPLPWWIAQMAGSIRRVS